MGVGEGRTDGRCLGARVLDVYLFDLPVCLVCCLDASSRSSTSGACALFRLLIANAIYAVSRSCDARSDHAVPVRLGATSSTSASRGVTTKPFNNVSSTDSAAGRDESSSLSCVFVCGWVAALRFLLTASAIDSRRDHTVLVPRARGGLCGEISSPGT